LGEAAARNGRHAVLVDDNPAAVEVMKRRLAFAKPKMHLSHKPRKKPRPVSRTGAKRPAKRPAKRRAKTKRR